MAALAEAINTLSSFLADEKITGVDSLNNFSQSLPTSTQQDGPQPVDAIVFCASSVLSLADVVFSAFAEDSDLRIDMRRTNTVLVLCGGIGHSTPFMYDAVARHPTYPSMHGDVQGEPEARILQLIAERWYGIRALSAGSEGAIMTGNDTGRLLVVVEDKSTNCGENASKSREILERCGVSAPRSIVVVQDPTMSKRTVATFEKVYSDHGDAAPRVISWPTFTPKVILKSESPVEEDKEPMDQEPMDQIEHLGYDGQDTTTGSHDLWNMKRLVDLLMGEIPRLRDDSNGYGPKGKNFLVHVDIPENVEKAWRYLDSLLGPKGRDR
ncbi:duf218 domain protein [Colletotrichum musicola]|uniref:Duf218 domain protein n=1 Tax=Colletotrichum musicola TaxID=2175873 RepID=A0A8H6U823_9PEZI|nr:duf218 domain protein [Colletotrichum musicola]